MPDVIQDARLRELAFLGKLEREGNVAIPSETMHKDPVLKAMLVYLLHEGYVNGLDTVPAQRGELTDLLLNFGGKSQLQAKFEGRLWEQIGRVLTDQATSLRISHKGRVRRSELEQALRAGRDREPFGILWAERHRDTAVIMAVLTAQSSAPVSLCYLDMNGLKIINDAYGHYAGDEAIRIYLHTIATVTQERAEAFRSGGADEVVVVMRATSADNAGDAMRDVLKQLGKECVRVEQKTVASCLTASCGIASTADPTTDAVALIRRADEEQRRAKEASRTAPGVSFLAIDGRDVERVGVPVAAEPRTDASCSVP
jgi:diguanylate cyclase (GGDEF)-like protein